jgi:ribosomal protein L20A (L18A)
MPIFTIKASETVFYQEEIQAETRDEAIEKFYDMMTSTLEPCDSDNFTIDHVEEEGDE